ncbi:MAG: tyrosine recombinase XerC [Chloroflexi bacterium]|nr:tyrosine recombinase XerC [Chloroflexota bacterium]
MTSNSAPAAASDDAAADAVDQLLYRYVATLSAERNLSPFTLRNYTSDLLHLFAHLRDRGVEPLAVTRLTFRGYLASMMESGVARASITRRVSTARSFYRWLRLIGVMSEDPLANVRGPKQARRLPHVLTLEHITHLIAAADDDTPAGLRDRALLELMYACGLRVSEAAGVDVPAVDLDERTVVVTGKGNKQRMVMIGVPARDALERYLRHGRPALTRARRQTRDAPLFLNRSGGRLSQRAVQMLVRKYALAAGINERVHPHLLRHTFATHLLDGGAELRVVQELLGHSNPNTTQIYLHVTEERQRSVLEGSLDGIAAVESARRSLSRDRARPSHGAATDEQV